MGADRTGSVVGKEGVLGAYPKVAVVVFEQGAGARFRREVYLVGKLYLAVGFRNYAPTTTPRSCGFFRNATDYICTTA